MGNNLIIPDNWDVTLISNVAKVDLGKTPKRTQYTNSGNNKIIKFRDVNYSGVDWENTEKGFVKDTALSELKGIELDDVLITASAHSPEHIGKKISFISRIPNNFKKVFYVGELLNIRVVKKVLVAKFIFYFFLSQNGYKSIQNRVKGVHLTSGEGRKIVVPIAPLPEQRAIVAKIEQFFSDLDNGIDNLKKTQKQLKIYRQAVLKNACEGKLVPTEAELAHTDGHDYEPADVLLARILKERRDKWNGKGKYKEPVAQDTTELPELPEGWCLANVGQMTDSMKNGIYKPKEFYAEEGFACLRMYNIDQGKIVWKDIKRMNLTKEEIDEYLLVPGDLLVNRVNSRELVGKAAVISSGIEKCVFESKNIRVRILNEVVNPYYLCYHFTLAGTEYFNRNAQQVVGMASISQPQIAGFPILLPPLAEQRRIVVEVERRFSLCDKLEATIADALQKSEALRQSILKKAFEGKLLNEKELEEARNAPDWEPADKLLERIKTAKAKPGTKKSFSGTPSK